jgi:lysophospholipase L1-like esterase
LPATDPGTLELKDGDCVVLIGSALIEREQRYGYWEAALTARFPGKAIRFRNLGWSGDTVFGEAQAGFGTAADGFKHLKEHVLSLKPTVIIVGYGTNEAFDGKPGLPRFVAGLNTLLDALAPTKAQVVLLSPLKQEALGRPLPDPTAQNESLRLYVQAIREVAAQRGSRFVDLFNTASPEESVAHLTDDEVHLTAFGYRAMVPALMRGLGLDPTKGPEVEQSERLRAAIVAKNWLYFHRWRPQNETYLFGFRKHEQGQNAVEIPKFDPLVAEAEKEITKLAMPVTHTYEPKREEKR